MSSATAWAVLLALHFTGASCRQQTQLWSVRKVAESLAPVVPGAIQAIIQNGLDGKSILRVDPEIDLGLSKQDALWYKTATDTTAPLLRTMEERRRHAQLLAKETAAEEAREKQQRSSPFLHTEESKDRDCFKNLDGIDGFDGFQIAEPEDNAVVVPDSPNILIRVKLPCCIVTRRFWIHVDIVDPTGQHSTGHSFFDKHSDFRDNDTTTPSEVAWHEGQCEAFEDFVLPLKKDSGKWSIYFSLLKNTDILDQRSTRIHLCTLKSEMSSIWLPFTRMHRYWQKNQTVRSMHYQPAVLPSYFKDFTSRGFSRCTLFISYRPSLPWPNLDAKRFMLNSSNDYHYHGCVKYWIRASEWRKSSTNTTRAPQLNSLLRPRVYVQLDRGLGNRLFNLAAAYAFCRRNNLTAPIAFNIPAQHDRNCDDEWGGHPIFPTAKRTSAHADLPVKFKDLFPHIMVVELPMAPAKSMPIGLGYENKFPSFYEIAAQDSVTLLGLAQSSEHFDEYFHDLVTDYLHPSAFVIDYLDKTYPWAKFPYIQRVCVHLRLGQSTDQMISYQPPRLSALYTMVLEASTSFRLSRFSETMVHIFTDNPERSAPFIHFISNELNLEATLVRDASYIELFLMSRCDALLIAASSFSWWGAYLGDRPDRPVFYEKRDHQPPWRVVPDHWVSIDAPPDKEIPAHSLCESGSAEQPNLTSRPQPRGAQQEQPKPKEQSKLNASHSLQYDLPEFKQTHQLRFGSTNQTVFHWLDTTAPISGSCAPVGHIPVLREFFRPELFTEYDQGLAQEKMVTRVFREVEAAALGAIDWRVRFIDVGAQVGVFSLLAKWWPPNLHVDAFEAYAPAHACLASNIAVNNLTNRVTAHYVAVGNESGRAQLNVCLSNPGFSTLGHSPQSFDADDADVASTELVEMCTLDDVLLHNDEALIALIKIDVEGCELDVLKGARGVIARDRPDLVLEINFDNMAQCHHSWEALVRELAPSYLVVFASGEDILLRHSADLGRYTTGVNLTTAVRNTDPTIQTYGIGWPE